MFAFPPNHVREASQFDHASSAEHWRPHAGRRLLGLVRPRERLRYRWQLFVPEVFASSLDRRSRNQRVSIPVETGGVRDRPWTPSMPRRCPAVTPDCHRRRPGRTARDARKDPASILGRAAATSSEWALPCPEPAVDEACTMCTSHMERKTPQTASASGGDRGRLSERRPRPRRTDHRRGGRDCRLQSFESRTGRIARPILTREALRVTLPRSTVGIQSWVV